MLDKIRIRLAEMFAPKESAVRGERGWMRGFEDQVLASIDQGRFLASVVSPEKKDQVLFFVRELLDNGIRERLPPFILMRSRLARTDGERCV